MGDELAMLVMILVCLNLLSIIMDQTQSSRHFVIGHGDLVHGSATGKGDKDSEEEGNLHV